MLRIDRGQGTLVPLKSKKLADVGLREREDLQRMIRQSADVFFEKMGEKLTIIGEEVTPEEVVSDRIDLLALDSEGAAVIIELKRASHKLHLLQALSYAAMISKWRPERFINELARMREKSPEAARQDFEEEFLSPNDLESENINQYQRIILLAEEFDFQILATAEWLYESYEIAIRCYRLALATNGEDEFLTCSRIYPPLELTDQARSPGGRSVSKGQRPSDWPAALQKVKNPTVRTFFESEIHRNREGAPERRTLRFRGDGKVRYRISAKVRFAYVSQRGRFENDEKFWADRLHDPNEIRPVAKGKRLRFHLQTEQDFQNFKQAGDGDLQNIPFITTTTENGEHDYEEEELEE